MRFGLIHRLMTNAMAVLGLLALLSSGEINAWVSGGLIFAMTLAIATPERFHDHPLVRQLGIFAPLGLLAIQLGRLALGGVLLELAVEFAAGLQVVRLATRRGAAHDQQVIVLALLHLIAGTVLGGGIAYGLCFLGFLIVAPGALVLSHLRREVEGNYRQGARDRTGLPVDVPRILRSRRVIGRSFLAFTCLLSVPIFVFTAALFVMFPRVGLSLLLLNQARPTRMVGFSDRVDLGGVGKLRTDPAIAMRVTYPGLGEHPPPRLALYLRGTAFDRYDGRAWSRSSQAQRRADLAGDQVPLIRRGDPARDLRLSIELEPIEPPVVFLPPDAVALAPARANGPFAPQDATITAGPEGEYRYRSPDERGLRYDVYVSPDASAGARLGTQRERYLTLPPDLPERVGALARRWAGGVHQPTAQAKALETRLRSDYRYDLESPSGAADNPLDHFLFESRRGHCEFYSTAMAIMARTLGLPSRNVTGFIGGTYNRFGDYYAVRQGDAHSWVEIFIEGRGWTRFDPTPPASAEPQSEITGALAFLRDLVEAAARRWSRNVEGYDLKQQVDLFRSVRARYDEVTLRVPWLRGLSSSPRRGLLLLLGVGLIVGSVIVLRRRARKGREGSSPVTERAAETRHIVALYRALESALSAAGVARPQSTPPLGHARALVEAGHPLGSEALALTRIYLEVRFGGRRLTAELASDFSARVVALRQVRTLRRVA